MSLKTAVKTKPFPISVLRQQITVVLFESGKYPKFFRHWRSRSKDLTGEVVVNWRSISSFSLNFSCLIDPSMPTEMRWLLCVWMLLPWPLDPETKAFVFGILERVLLSPLVIINGDPSAPDRLCSPCVDQLLPVCTPLCCHRRRSSIVIYRLQSNQDLKSRRLKLKLSQYR